MKKNTKSVFGILFLIGMLCTSCTKVEKLPMETRIQVIDIQMKSSTEAIEIINKIMKIVFFRRCVNWTKKFE